MTYIWWVPSWQETITDKRSGSSTRILLLRASIFSLGCTFDCKTNNMSVLMSYTLSQLYTSALCITVHSERTWVLDTCWTSWTLGRVACRYITWFDKILTSLNRNIYRCSTPSVSWHSERVSSCLTWQLCRLVTGVADGYIGWSDLSSW
jgi:hypothetical protein